VPVEQGSNLPVLEIRRIAVIGAGPAGRHFAAACLRAGLQVTLEDVMPANLRRAEADLAAISGLLDLALTVEDAVREADLAIDFVPDELESKLEIFSMADRMAPPRTILCTPTEVLSITDLASCVYRPDRCFALRGLPFASGSQPGAKLDLLYPSAADPAALASVERFLSDLGFQSTALLDPEPPLLVKNQPEDTQRASQRPPARNS
jgi:3-hydroxybutyryl-CoA dehydrogenase